MKKFLVALALITIMDTSSEAVPPQLSPQCKVALEPALKELGKTADDLINNERDARLFKETYFNNAEKWNKFASVCSSTVRETVDCLACTGGQCSDIFTSCFWVCSPCPNQASDE